MAPRFLAADFADDADEEPGIKPHRSSRPSVQNAVGSLRAPDSLRVGATTDGHKWTRMRMPPRNTPKARKGSRRRGTIPCSRDPATPAYAETTTANLSSDLSSEARRRRKAWRRRKAFPKGSVIFSPRISRMTRMRNRAASLPELPGLLFKTRWVVTCSRLAPRVSNHGCTRMDTDEEVPV